MVSYYSTYKCRLCGKTFISGMTSSQEVVNQNLLHLVCEAPLKTNMGIPITKLYMHSCEDGSVGLADFIGFKAEVTKE